MSASVDYYAQLGLSRDATPVEIKTAFKKLALRYHPDVYKGEDAHERMRQLLQAYQTLIDPAARQQYDAELTSSRRTTSATYNSPASGATSTSFDPARRARQAASSWARRDRHRYYDFPEFQPGRPVHVDLIDIAYTLSPQEARELVRYGLLRGIARQTEDHGYFCHRCHYRWPANQGAAPARCPKCQSTDWPEYLLLRCMHCCAVFESEQIRNIIGTLSYGKGRAEQELCPPYELFPLCPYCGTAHWSQAEEERVGQLRQQAERRATYLRLLMFGLLLAVIVVMGVVLLSGRY